MRALNILLNLVNNLRMTTDSRLVVFVWVFLLRLRNKMAMPMVIVGIADVELYKAKEVSEFERSVSARKVEVAVAELMERRIRMEEKANEINFETVRVA